MERALQEFTNIASSETYKDHVGAICGMATAYMLLKQVRREGEGREREWRMGGESRERRWTEWGVTRERCVMSGVVG